MQAHVEHARHCPAARFNTVRSPLTAPEEAWAECPRSPRKALWHGTRRAAHHAGGLINIGQVDLAVEAQGRRRLRVPLAAAQAQRVDPVVEGRLWRGQQAARRSRAIA